MTIANKGVRYKTHLVHSVRSYDGTIESVVEPEILAKADLSEEAIQTVHEGMVKVVKSGTGARYFRGASYDLAAKTGTAETGSKENPQSDHSVFIGYAPAENPEVAIAVMLENGASSAGNIAGRSWTPISRANRRASPPPLPMCSFPDGRLLHNAQEPVPYFFSPVRGKRFTCHSFYAILKRE